MRKGTCSRCQNTSPVTATPPGILDPIPQLRSDSLIPRALAFCHARTHDNVQPLGPRAGASHTMAVFVPRIFLLLETIGAEQGQTHSRSSDLNAHDLRAANSGLPAACQVFRGCINGGPEEHGGDNGKAGEHLDSRIRGHCDRRCDRKKGDKNGTGQRRQTQAVSFQSVQRLWRDLIRHWGCSAGWCCTRVWAPAVRSLSLQPGPRISRLLDSWGLV